MTYQGDKTIYLQDNNETDIMKGSLLDCFQSACSWAKDGEEINFHIKNTSQDEIAKLRKHIEKKSNHSICDEGDNEHRVKIKVEYTARNIITYIYNKYNRPSTHHIRHIEQNIDDKPKEITEEPKKATPNLFDDSEDGLSLQDLL